jgi:microcystin-dependent protein
MGDQFLGEIRLFGIGFTPKGWLACEGQIMPIAQNQALFSLLGITYGGDGSRTFALPDLRGRVPVHAGTAIPLGTSAGEATHTLTINEIPLHTHTVMGSSNAADNISPRNNTWGSRTDAYSNTANASLHPSAVSNAGGNQSHNNMQPSLAINFCIATTGIYPSRP